MLWSELTIELNAPDLSRKYVRTTRMVKGAGTCVSLLNSVEQTKKTHPTHPYNIFWFVV